MLLSNLRCTLLHTSMLLFLTACKIERISAFFPLNNFCLNVLFNTRFKERVMINHKKTREMIEWYVF